MVKSPKVYIRDTEILHSLLRIQEINYLLGHPVAGGSFESLVIEIKSSTAPKIEKGFWNSVKFLKPDEMWCIAQVDSTYPGGSGLWITSLELFLKEKIDEM